MPAPAVVDLGRAGYAATRGRMLALAERVRRGEVPGEIWLVEHEPVYTAGRATPRDELHAGIVPVERGGRITYHGPGQLVVYPVLPVPGRDVRGWLRRLERLGVAVCADFGIAATSAADGTGVFVGSAKVVSIGVAIKHWVSVHGLAINVAMELTAFARVRPCGLDPSRMTDLSRAAGRAIDLDAVKEAVRRHVHVLETVAEAVGAR